jgi:CHAT domain-containing protein/Tfp pilus assembly protein PilF
MGRTSYPSRAIVPLLFLLLGSGTAVAPSAESLYRDADAAFKRGDVKKAGVIASGALQRFGDSDEPWVWRLRLVHGTVLTSQGNHEGARELLERSLPPRLAGTDIEVLRLQGLAMVARRRKEQVHAETLITQAYELAKKKHPRTLPMLLVYRATIDTKNSAKWAREALQLARQFNDVDAELRARGTIARDLANHERFDEAIAMWEAAIPQARKSGDVSLMQKFEGNLGWGYLELGNYENASEFFTRAHATATKVGANSDLVPWTYQLGNVRMKQGDLAGAETYYRAALDLATKIGHEQKPIALAYVANFELRQGRLSEAQRYNDQATRERRAAKDVEGELRSLLLAGRIATSARKFDEAERLLKDVAARTVWKSTKAEVHGRLAQLYVTQGNFASADEQFRQSMAVMRDARENVDDMELRFSFFTAVDELLESYVDFLIARGRNADALRVTESVRAQTLEEALPDVVEPRDVREIARDTGATILCYWLGSANSYLWIVTPKRLEVVKLPPKRVIEAEIDAYQADLLGKQGTLSRSGARGKALWQMLVGPASRSIAHGSRVLIVPHGRLDAFNMETLVVPSAKPHYWIHDAVIATASSLELLVRNDRKRVAQPRLLLVGNPPPAAREFAPLPRAAAEMNKVARHFSGRAVILSGAKATPSAYRSAAPNGFTFLHFVAHGVATRQKPLDSAVVLAREGDTFKLYARDIARQPLTAKLVTISSCHGAGTRAYAGEGLVGLGWAFLRAGADNVIAALWEVSDAATPELMDNFYANLAKSSDPAAALRDAKLSLMNRGGVYARPLYWAPFLLYGDS